MNNFNKFTLDLIDFKKDSLILIALRDFCRAFWLDLSGK